MERAQAIEEVRRAKMLVELVGIDRKRPARIPEQARARGVPEQDQTARIPDRQRLQQHCVDEREDRRIGPDAEGEGHHGDHREARRSAQHPQRVAHVPPEGLHRRFPPDVSRPFFHGVQTADLDARRADGGLTGEAGCHLLFDGRFQIGAELFVHVLFHPCLVEQTPEPVDDAAKYEHHSSPNAYSVRNATIGSIRVARSAGRNAASNATLMTNTETAPNVRGSKGWMSTSIP